MTFGFPRLMSCKKFPISALPLAPKPNLLTHNLTADSHTPTPQVFRTKVLAEYPSIQRRARLLPGQSHFSYVTPFPVPFPYDIEAPVDRPPQDSNRYIEQWLSERESVHLQPPPVSHPNVLLRKYASKNRDQLLELIGISETGLRDCVPHLNVGDAFAILGAPTLANEFGDEGNPQPSDDQEVVDARKDLIEVLGGQATLMSPPLEDEEMPSDAIAFAPWSLRYSGHQFGSWAGQLGDGRAVSVLVTPHPSDADLTYELQLKGCGRTPFSRSADGLAVLRSSIREYLGSEAMEALKIPTTRSLTLISLPSLPVARERMELGCILTRMAPSFIRIGCFEAFNGPTNMFIFGGGQQKPDWEGLRILGEWVSNKVLKLDLEPGKAWGSSLVLDVARRNAKMVAGWQAYGFMHGVINTDNVSILGLTIDYGPFAFMDVFDSNHICNHTDETGLYSYKNQPRMIIFALRALLDALAPLIGAEDEVGGKAVTEGWGKDVSEQKIKAWTEKGKELGDEVVRVIQETMSLEYGRLMRKRLGLRSHDPSDEAKVTRPLLQLLEHHKVDFHSTFRTLSTFKPFLLKDMDPSQPAEALTPFVNSILSVSPDARIHGEEARQDLIKWLETYGQRIESEKEEWLGNEDIDNAREKEMKAVNPRFVLRQWLLEEVIKAVERDLTSGKRVLAKIMHMSCNPFEAWGAEGDERPETELDKEEREERRFCGLGEKKWLGFQCSCSS